jgi:hypothetical protein
MNFPSPFAGADFTYFIIGEVREDRLHDHGAITMYGFLDQAARQANAACVTIPVTLAEGSWIKDASIAQLYTLVKTTPEFAGAVDA